MDNKLYWCPSCKENSVRIKRHGTWGNQRIEFCVNKGCGYKRVLPVIKACRIERRED